MTNALRMIASADPTELLEISLDTGKVELEMGESYTFTSYGRYYTTTVPTSVYWSMDDETLGELSCGSKKAKTCTFLSGNKAMEATLTINAEQKGTIFTDTAKIKVVEPLKSSFKDDLPSWARKGILKLNQLGIIKGYNDGRFGAADPLTRSQVVTLLYRFKDSMKTLDATAIKNKKCDVFSDVSSSHFAYTPICYFYYAGGLDVKNGTFNPDESAPRGLTSFYLYNVFSNDLKKTSTSTTKTVSFSDVPLSHQYYNAISSMNTYGIMTGYDSGSFGPDSTLNRAEAATVLFRVQGLLEDVTGSLTSVSSSSGQSSLLATCDNETHVRGYVSQALGNNLSQFELRKFQPEVLSEQLSAGTLDLSFVDKNGALVAKTVTITPDILRLSGVSSGSVKNTHGSNNAQGVALPSEQGYKLNCEDGTQCGVLTLLDEENTQIEATFVDAELGFSFLEPASNLIALSGGSQSQVQTAGSCHVFYNSAHHADVLATQHEEGDSLTQALRFLAQNGLASQARAANPVDDLFIGQIPIVLDADQAFYAINTRTVWSRQRSVLAGVNLIYGLVDALGHGNFSIVFRIAGQEAWLPGYGPTNLDWEDVLNEINDEDYYMINHPDPDENEISYFFIGYDLEDGIAGGAYEGTFCSSTNDSYNHALGQQVPDNDDNYAFSTLYGRQIVMSHEIGHMLNANHASAQRNVCGPGLWSNLCGSTLLKSGATGGAAPDNRMFFFSATNSQRVRDCVEGEIS